MKILHIDASILGPHSVSRSLTSAIVSRLVDTNPGAEVTYRDVAADPPPYFSGAIVAAATDPESPVSAETQQAASHLGKILEEVLAADVIVVGAPMYNFGIPAQLKSWLDALAVPGKTFRYTSSGAEGLLVGKRVIIASSQGGIYAEGTPSAAFEHQESHLHSFLMFVGITDIQVVRADGVKMAEGPARVETALKQAAELQLA
ncbi:FMN-dependent NADH-azoreductase [Blastopirellula marina]|uniref:FMN dependent NADH:quinone oxidoreductase n=1 Tax=Blastopirellula marina TaxID=124 RepID=A0A2S8G967_9BACT|nr:FMN-dependent NADH-azoreductase [Blastopirellula marina]PQO41005.1 FMN-dependent NADH-azoreductase [Blastopirellula marina]PTL45888.1 FMN-dependent NADH-azoreductase [Blastopirellula marina]